jgi:hypothetical protein
MHALSRRTLIAASLSALATPGFAASVSAQPAARPLTDDEKAAVIRAFGFVGVDNVEAALEAPAGRNMVTALAELMRQHVTRKACTSAPTGAALDAFTRDLFLGMVKADLEARLAAQRLPLAYDLLVGEIGQARVDAMAAAMGDTEVQSHVAVVRRMLRLEFVYSVYGKLLVELTQRGDIQFPATDGSEVTAGIEAQSAAAGDEANAIRQRGEARPAFKLYLEMLDPVLGATQDADAAEAADNLSLVDRFKDRLATVCVG